MPHKHDGPASPLFEALPFGGNVSFKALSGAEVSPTMRAWAAAAPRGACTAWGIPFEIKRPLLVKKSPVSVDAGLVKAVFARAGQAVAKGDRLAVLEAMKMEHVLTAARDGVVAEVLVAEAAQVEAGAALIRLEEAA